MYECKAPAAWLIDLVHSSKSGRRPQSAADIHAPRQAGHILKNESRTISVLREE
jgi:hypothetical protein